MKEWYSSNGYRDRFVKKLGSIKDAVCMGEYGVNMACVWNNMVCFFFLLHRDAQCEIFKNMC